MIFEFLECIILLEHPVYICEVWTLIKVFKMDIAPNPLALIPTDKFGRRPVILCSSAIYILGSLVAGLAQEKIMFKLCIWSNQTLQIHIVYTQTRLLRGNSVINVYMECIY